MKFYNGGVTIADKKREFKWLAEKANHVLDNFVNDSRGHHDLDFLQIQEAIKKSITKKLYKDEYICYHKRDGVLYVGFFKVSDNYVVIQTMYHPQDQLLRREEEMKNLKDKLKTPSGGKRNTKDPIDEVNIEGQGHLLPLAIREDFEKDGYGHIKTEEDLTEYLKTCKSKPIQLH